MDDASPERFGQASRAALADEGLRGALARATALFTERRAAAIEKAPEWEAWREEARRVKAATLERLDHYLERFAERAGEAGARVHWARDAVEACETIAAIAAAAGARTVVKGKSMTSEEIGLNGALERAGLRPVETDLGEWIVQLAGEAPSHIIAPAIHKTKEDVAELFARELDLAPTSDVEELCAIARRVLRREMSGAEVGISGVNFAVAETGTILILENEGNIRMTTSLPRVHVALMGIEKVIPRLADLEVFLRLLPRSGTGQELTSYQSLLTGPKGAQDREGPDELHIVLLDGGRSSLLADPLLSSSLACIRCGACLNACPVYREVGGHAYGSVYPGPIGSVLTPELVGLSRAAPLPFASSLCGACRDVCPVKIDLPEMLLALRAAAVAGGVGEAAGSSRSARACWRLWSFAFSGPRRYALASRLARLAQGLGLLRLFPPLAAWSRGRERPRLARRSFRELWAAGLEGAGADPVRVARAAGRAAGRPPEGGDPAGGTPR